MVLGSPSTINLNPCNYRLHFGRVWVNTILAKLLVGQGVSAYSAIVTHANHAMGT